MSSAVLKIRSGMMITVVGDVVLFNRSVARNGRKGSIHLAPLEERTLRALMLNVGRAISHGELIEYVYLAYGREEPDTGRETLSVHVAKLRHKVKRLGIVIEAWHGYGYTLTVK